MVRRAKTMKTLPDHWAADVDSLPDLGLFNLPWAAGRTLMSMAVSQNKNTGLSSVKSHNNIHVITYKIKIMLSGIALIKHSIF